MGSVFVPRLGLRSRPASASPIPADGPSIHLRLICRAAPMPEAPGWDPSSSPASLAVRTRVALVEPSTLPADSVTAHLPILTRYTDGDQAAQALAAVEAIRAAVSHSVNAKLPGEGGHALFLSVAPHALPLPLHAQYQASRHLEGSAGQKTGRARSADQDTCFAS